MLIIDLAWFVLNELANSCRLSLSMMSLTISFSCAFLNISILSEECSIWLIIFETYGSVGFGIESEFFECNSKWRKISGAKKGPMVSSIFEDLILFLL